MSALTRKHFECIAEHLRNRFPEDDAPDQRTAGYWQAIRAVAAALREINPRFDTNRFMQACEPKDSLV